MICRVMFVAAHCLKLLSLIGTKTQMFQHVNVNTVAVVGSDLKDATRN